MANNPMLYATMAMELKEARAELAATTAERARYGDMMSAALGQCENERDGLRAEVAELRAAMVSLLDGKSEFDVEYDTGMSADEARRIMTLAYQRGDNSN